MPVTQLRLQPWLVRVLAGTLAGALAGQALELPTSQTSGGRELDSASLAPFMTPASHMQVLYDASELGGQTSRLVSRVALRFDGPTGGPARSHTVQRLSLRLGVTTVSVAAAGASFPGNLSQALAPGIDGMRVDYVTDGNTGAGPEPFGAGGQFVLPFAQPVQVIVPPGGAFVFDLRCEGNDNATDPAFLDLSFDPANLQGAGVGSTNGRGCPVSLTLPGPVVETFGAYEPGGAISIAGRGFLPNAPIVSLLTTNILTTPLAFPNTSPVCWAYVATETTLLAMPSLATATGELIGGDPVPIPKRPAPAGALVYVQSVTVAEPMAGNLFGLASSNYRTIRIGLQKLPTVGAWTAVNHASATAPTATLTFFGAPALRLE